jgi:hypothetical protein
MLKRKILGKMRKCSQYETKYMNKDKTGYIIWTERRGGGFCGLIL